MTVSDQIRAAYAEKPYLTTFDLVRRFGCNEATVHRALQGTRKEDGRSTQPGKNGRAYVPLPELELMISPELGK